MACARYRLYLADQPASTAQLNSFETITVTQEMDMSWTAQLEFPLRTDARGKWTGESEAWLQPLSRLRLEVSVQGRPYVPLIDGSIVSSDYGLQMEPGQSALHIEVQDDGFLLHRDETVKLYPDMTDDEIAEQIYLDAVDIASIDIDEADGPADLSDNTTVLRGTQMELLQFLAQRQGMHAFVLPGPQPHTSVGCFKYDPDPQLDFGLPEMVLLGSNRNLMSLKLWVEGAQPAVYCGSTVSLSDKSVNSRTADLSDIDRLGPDPPPGTPIKRFLRPGKALSVDLDRATQAASEDAAYALHADGEVLKDTYGGVLAPYQNVQMRGSNGRLSGSWLIRQVTHTLTRNSYGQTFSMQRNAESAGAGNTPPPAPPGVF